MWSSEPKEESLSGEEERKVEAKEEIQHEGDKAEERKAEAEEVFEEEGYETKRGKPKKAMRMKSLGVKRGKK